MNNPNLVISSPTINDVKRLSAFCNTTFYDTYHSYNTAKNMEAYMKENFNVDKIKQELTDNYTHFFIASVNNELVAYAKLKKVNMPSEYAHEQDIEIERIYVKKEHKGLKIGSLLMQHSIDYAKSINCDARATA
jgi:ribosomal protein S18 acetylase RimI-like enzyme